MTDKTDTRIPLDYDAGRVVNLPGFGEDMKPILGTTETALSQMGQAITRTIDARAHAERNAAWPEPAKIVMTHLLAEKLHKGCVEATFKARSALETVANAAEEQLSAPIRETASHHTSAEIRAHVKKLSVKERMRLLEEAMKEKDLVTMSSVLGARPFLSGLTPKLHHAMARDWNRRTNPDAVRRLDLAHAADEMLVERLRRLEHHLYKAVGASRDEAVAMRKRQRDAEMAFKVGD